MTQNDIEGTLYVEENRWSWQREDCIRWVEWRVREITIQGGKYVDERGKWLLEEKAAGGRKLTPGDEVADYAVWLLKARDHLSWHQIAYRFFPAVTEKAIGKYVLRVRRMYNRVERNHPGSKAFKQERLSNQEKLLLQAVTSGVIPIYLSAPPLAHRNRRHNSVSSRAD